FDGALREALNVSLSQSPYFNLVTSEKIAEALKTFGFSANQPITSELAPKLCAATEAKAFVNGTISLSDGSYSISLEAKSCAAGMTFAKAHAAAPNPRQVLHALGASGTDLRRQLGERAETLRKFDTPLERATSPSLEAVKLYSEGRRLTREK